MIPYAKILLRIGRHKQRMKLKSINYSENIGRTDANQWVLRELTLENQNLIIAKNATGKSRILGVTLNLAKLIQAPQKATINGIPQKNTASGEWCAIFSDKTGIDIVYSLAIKNGTVTSEHITVDGNVVLKREGTSAIIHSYITNTELSISPPNDCLVLHVRRDEKEFPFLEKLASWANGVRGLSFANTSPNLIEIPGTTFQLSSLNAVPSVLDQLSSSQVKKVLNQLKGLDYDIENAITGLVEGLPPSAKIVFIKERGLSVLLKQFEMSQGMFRAFSLLVIMEFFRTSDKIGCILIDDLGEGLDSDRSQKLAKVIFDKQDHPSLQLIATSNEAFLMNSVHLNDLTVCYRTDSSIKCLNYSNSKTKFDKWRQLGLNNFDLLSSNFLLDRSNE